MEAASGSWEARRTPASPSSARPAISLLICAEDSHFRRAQIHSGVRLTCRDCAYFCLADMHTAPALSGQRLYTCNSRCFFREQRPDISLRWRGRAHLRCLNEKERGTSQSADQKDAAQGGSKSQLNLQDPVETIAWGGNLPSRRRAITGGLSGLAISMSFRLTVHDNCSPICGFEPYSAHREECLYTLYTFACALSCPQGHQDKQQPVVHRSLQSW